MNTTNEMWFWWRIEISHFHDTGYAKFLFYILMAVEEAQQQFKLATDYIDEGRALINLDMER